MKKTIILLMACAIFSTSSYAYNNNKEYVNKINEMALDICESRLEGNLISYMKYDNKDSQPLCYSYTMNYSFYDSSGLFERGKVYDIFSEDVFEEIKMESRKCNNNNKNLFVIFNPVNYKVASMGCTNNRAKKL